MIRQILYFAFFFISLSACTEGTKEKSPDDPKEDKPQISNNGEVIEFKEWSSLFKTEKVEERKLQGEFLAPATVVASIISPSRIEANPIILFEDPELNALYSAYLQSLAHYKRDIDFLARVKDMYSNKAATGRELKEAETGVTDAATELAEKEGRFRMLGFNPQELSNAPLGNVWLLSDVPENVINNLNVGSTCEIQFTSFPSESFAGQISAIGDVLDGGTRTLKVRILLANSNNRFKPGMYARIRFFINEESAMAISASSVVSVQGKNYVFKKEGNKVTRTEVIIENQIGDNVVVLKGLKSGDIIVKEGAMLLKGLSFGY